MAGLRETKKQQQRQAISDTATRLFRKRGYATVTIADIAAAAGVAKMTVTNYFPRKEDLALDMADAFTDSLAATVAERAPGESALGALRSALRKAVRRREPLAGFTTPDFARLILESPALTARLRELHEQREQRLAEQLAIDTKAPAGDITPQAVAAQLGAAHRLLYSETLRRSRAGEPADKISRAILRATDRVFDLLQPALAEYAVRPPAS